ncbi:hypothetical protein VitviT2T_015622 [Vitis vinifera]|uniref:PPM-type phosphatase domain-containing protein n=1 Tax=Vitis vinifera TaxID=29760 RepID=A0ABY9CQJ7_VITVI|nr:hypothetical protein VitviT2T_015622 [Vitis vinifera]
MITQKRTFHLRKIQQRLSSDLGPLHKNIEDDKKLSSRRLVTHGFHLVRGKRDHGMEDYIVAEKRQINGNELGLYAIFDGHSGKQVAEYLHSHLFDNILQKRVYEVKDDEILESVVGSRGGSTAVTAILINGEKLIVGNVGDSRAIIFRESSVEQITVDHEPQKERSLVESRGGFVSKLSAFSVIYHRSVPRVDGQLAMARAIGDEKLKEHITSEPDVAIVMMDTDVKFIILADDGLWNVMSNQEAADCIRELRDGQETYEELIKEALSRGSHEDISCVVVAFH